jgi:hypothetical protein
MERFISLLEIISQVCSWIRSRILAHTILLLMACGRFTFGRARGGARPHRVRVGVSVAESWRGVVVGFSKLRLGSMRFSGSAGAVSGDVVEFGARVISEISTRGRVSAGGGFWGDAPGMNVEVEARESPGWATLGTLWRIWARPGNIHW